MVVQLAETVPKLEKDAELRLGGFMEHILDVIKVKSGERTAG